MTPPNSHHPGYRPDVHYNFKELTQEVEALRAKLGLVQQENEERELELEQLRLLQVWTGHPCALCGKRLRGVVEPEVARALLKDLVHKKCLKDEETGGWFPITVTFLEPRRIPAE